MIWSTSFALCINSIIHKPGQKSMTSNSKNKILFLWLWMLLIFYCCLWSNLNLKCFRNYATTLHIGGNLEYIILKFQTWISCIHIWLSNWLILWQQLNSDLPILNLIAFLCVTSCCLLFPSRWQAYSQT